MRAQLGLLVVGLLALFGVTAQPQVALSAQLGDVNCDGAVNSTDAALVLQFSAGLISTLPCQAAADVSGDGSINAIDATLVLQLSAGLIEAPSTSGRPLQVHHIDVEQGDAALIISPGGEVVMIDDGRWTNCSNTVTYLQSVGIGEIDYHFASHYHGDAIGCLDDLAAAGIAVEGACYDRGTVYNSSSYNDYVATCGERRQTLSQGQVITLDQGSATPVTITVIALNGAGQPTSDENALSLVLRLTYGAFDEVFAGDLTGDIPDIESVVAPQVGDVEVYKVSNHGSRLSSNETWLDTIAPEVAIISVGFNTVGHPEEETLRRLHDRQVRTYWTNEGSGAAPDPTLDRVGGTIVIEALPGVGQEFTVSGDNFTHRFRKQ